jgi:hypothetical protein
MVGWGPKEICIFPVKKMGVERGDETRPSTATDGIPSASRAEGYYRPVGDARRGIGGRMGTAGQRNYKLGDGDGGGFLSGDTGRMLAGPASVIVRDRSIFFAII